MGALFGLFDLLGDLFFPSSGSYGSSYGYGYGRDARQVDGEFRGFVFLLQLFALALIVGISIWVFLPNTHAAILQFVNKPIR